MDISNNLSCNTHEVSIALNANTSLGFAKRNLKTKSREVREMAYQTLTAIWDPHTKENTHKIEMVQRCAACWAMNDYIRTTSVTSLLQQLDWQTLEERRNMVCVWLLYKIINGIVAVPLPDYIKPTHRISRYCNSMTFHQNHTGKDSYKYTFFPLAIYCPVECPSRKCCDFSKS